MHIAFFHTPVDVNFQTNNIVDIDCRPEGQNQCYSHFGGTLPTPSLQQVSIAISYLLPEMTMNFKVIERMTQKVNNICLLFGQNGSSCLYHKWPFLSVSPSVCMSLTVNS